MISEYYNLIISVSPDVEKFVEMSKHNPDFLTTIVDASYNGTALHATAKWDTIYNRDGLLTRILLLQFGANPNVHVNGSLPVYWALNQVAGGKSAATAKLFLLHREFDLSKSTGKRGSAREVIMKEYSFEEVSECIRMREEVLKLEDEREVLRKRLLSFRRVHSKHLI